MIQLDKTKLQIPDRIITRYQNVTGDSDELLADIFKHMIENETGLSFDNASKALTEEKLSSIVLERINLELSAFGG